MKIVVVVCVILLCFFAPFSTSNAYLQTEVYEINAIGNANHIYPGQVLKIPILYRKHN